MGNYASKLFYTNGSQKECSEHQARVQQATMENNSACTPILSGKRVLGDPRSISAGINRTPIEIKCTPIAESKKTPSAIPKYLQKKQYLETDMDVVMPPLTPKKRSIPKSRDSDEQSDSVEMQDSTPNVNVAKDSKIITSIDKERFIILGLDPRSPATDFDRTPILMPKSLALIKARSRENLSRRGSYETDIYNPKNFSQEIDISLNISKIQLSSTTSENLKTLNTDEQDGLLSTSLYDSLSISKSEEENTVIKNPKYMSEEEKSLVLNEQTVMIDNEESKDETVKQEDCENIEFNTKIKDSNKIELWHDSLSSKESVSGKETKKELSQKKVSRQDVIITFDKYTMISTSLKPIKTDFRKKRDAKGKKTIKTEVKFNEEKVFTPENKQKIEIHETRTPLSNRSNNGQIQKKPQQLLRNKAASIETQENTPPHKINNGKTRNGTQWDPNSTVLI